jgi:hypothetical protein
MGHFRFTESLCTTKITYTSTLFGENN